MSEAQQISVLETTRLRLEEIVRRENLLNAAVSVLARQLTPEEAIGTPGRRDFPIIIGKERVIEATVLGSKGHAFTDSPQEFTGTIEEVLNFELNTNQHRAIYIATLNAVLRHLHRVTATVVQDTRLLGRDQAVGLEGVPPRVDPAGPQFALGLEPDRWDVTERIFKHFLILTGPGRFAERFRLRRTQGLLSLGFGILYSSGCL